MKKNSVYCIIVCILTLFLGFTGCSNRQEVTLNSNGSGSALITVEMNQVLIDYLQDFSVGLGYGEFQEDVFDPTLLAEALGEQGLTLTQYQRIDDLLWTMDVQFDTLQLPPLITTTQEQNLYTLNFRYNYEIFQAFKEFFGPEVQEFFELLGPGDSYVSREEYIDFLLFAFDAYIDNPTAFRLLLEQQELRVTIQLEGELVSVEGGRVLPSGDVEFVIPMVDFASGDLDMQYSLQWLDNSDTE